MTKIEKNTLEVGTNGNGEVVINHPEFQTTNFEVSMASARITKRGE